MFENFRGSGIEGTHQKSRSPLSRYFSVYFVVERRKGGVAALVMNIIVDDWCS